NAAGDGFDTTACLFCGDGKVNAGVEACDGAATTPTTCNDLGYTGDPEPVTLCTNKCQYDTGVCSRCPGANCLSSGSCSGTSCTGKECQPGSTCTFDCGYNSSQTCDDVLCGTGSTCTFTCQGAAGGCTKADCNNNATCTFTCNDSGSDCNASR